MLQKCGLILAYMEMIDIIYGEGKGVITATNGNEYATATGCSVGRHTKSGKMRYAGIISIGQVNVKAGPSFLNNLVVVIEYEVHHKSCSYTYRLWEWK